MKNLDILVSGGEGDGARLVMNTEQTRGSDRKIGRPGSYWEILLGMRKIDLLMDVQDGSEGT